MLSLRIAFDVAASASVGLCAMGAVKCWRHQTKIKVVIVSLLALLRFNFQVFDTRFHYHKIQFKSRASAGADFSWPALTSRILSASVSDKK